MEKLKCAYSCIGRSEEKHLILQKYIRHQNGLFGLLKYGSIVSGFLVSFIQNKYIIIIQEVELIHGKLQPYCMCVLDCLNVT